MPPITHIFLFGNSFQDSYIAEITNFVRDACQRNLDVSIEPTFMSYLSSHGVELPPEVHVSEVFFPTEGAAAAISIGGDGTFLRTARRVGRSGVPVLGINTGHLGFLSHYTFAETPRLLDALKRGDMRIESRDLLRVSAEDLPEDIWPYALNEVAILKEDTSSMISSRVKVDDCFIADYLSDGVLISTPTGSTAYNLSVGGPILQPTLHCMVIAPISPHTLTLRPLVVSDCSCVELTTTSRASEYRLSLDGCGCLMRTGSTVKVSKADFCVNVLLRRYDDFATPLRNKLLWGIR